MASEHDRFLSSALSNVPGLVWPPVNTRQSAALLALLASLEESQWYAPDEIAALQNRQLVALADHAARESAHFARRLADAGLTPAQVGTTDGFLRLPVITKKDVQDAGESLFCRTVPDGHGPVGSNKSSGSTGEPVVIRRSTINQLDLYAMTLRSHRWHRRRFSDRLCGVRAHVQGAMTAPNWGPPVNQLFPSGPGLALSSSLPINRLAAEIARFNPHYLIIYPSILGGLIDYWKTHGKALTDLREIELIGETFSPTARAEAADFLHVKLTDLYSSQEAGHLALECPDSGLYHIMAETVRVEILDAQNRPCRPGEIGRVVVTDLRNFAAPLVRYDLGDYAEVGQTCPCGRGLPSLARIAGRVRNLVTLPNGERHWPQLGFGEFRTIAPIRQYQIIQEDTASLDVRLVADSPLSPAQETAIGAVIQRKVGYPFALRFHYFTERLPTSPGGKFEEFLSRL